jgi:hypothetical protein
MTTDYYDYGQLLDRLIPEKVGDEEGQISALNDILIREYHIETDEYIGESEGIIVLMRDFLDGLLVPLEEHDHTYPLFLGLSEIENDWTFVKFFMVLIEHMWA